MHSFLNLIPLNKLFPLNRPFYALCFLVVAGFVPGYGQRAPCSTPEYRQFDFWVGEWEVFHPTADTLLGENHIKNILNGCVIEENWSSRGGSFQGKSFNTYNPVDSTWNQVWVDTGGSTYHFSGQYADYVMMMKGETISRRTGGKVLFEMSYTYDPETDTVRQVWKSSNDEGASWNTIFDGVYKKR